ncbi:hypothetical protein FSARC_11598 [Fusarium sarcochroum]|uniref:NmrA-like domain-containing protein n=1 Tax=Fusarium sarcochroum TaxID=1208366 RepID=A0A8H4TEN2_9HYPO|nr:hypothetical protein FSARC_11598 [Fusarium sarcochroum]
MGIIAIAGGTGSLGKTVIEQLKQHGSHHHVYILGRRAPENSASNFPKLLQVDYADLDSLTRTLQDHKIDTVVSTINLDSEASSQSQLNLIAAAEKSQTTSRFIPSEFVPLIDEDKPGSVLGMGGWVPSARALKKTNLEYIHISIGMFSDYFGMPHIKSNLKSFSLFLDIENKRAAVPGNGDARISVTYSEDLARFIVRLLDDDGKWPERGILSGSDISANELVATAEKVTGCKLNVVHDTLENIQKGEVTVFHYPEGISEDEWKPSLAKFYEMFITGSFLLPDDGRRLNRRYPEIPVTSAEQILAQAWKGRV